MNERPMAPDETDTLDDRPPAARTPAGSDALLDTAALDPGSQVIGLVSSSDEPLLALPPPAFRNLLVVSTRLTPRRIETMLDATAREVTNVGVVPATAMPTEYDGPLWTTESVRPADLTGLGIRVSEAARHLEPGRGWVLLDAVTMLLMYADEPRVHRFTNTMMRNLAARNVRAIYCLCPDAISDQTLERFRGLGHAELDLRG